MNLQTVVNSVTSLTWLCSGFKLTTRSSVKLQYDVGWNVSSLAVMETQGCTNLGKGTCFSVSCYHNKHHLRDKAVFV